MAETIHGNVVCTNLQKVSARLVLINDLKLFKDWFNEENRQKLCFEFIALFHNLSIFEITTLWKPKYKKYVLK